MKYLIKLDDGKFLLKFGRYTIYRRDETEKNDCLKTEKELNKYINLLKNTTIKNYKIIEVKIFIEYNLDDDIATYKTDGFVWKGHNSIEGLENLLNYLNKPLSDQESKSLIDGLLTEIDIIENRFDTDEYVCNFLENGKRR